MLGINDPMIYCAYFLSFACLIFCIWYGALNWNKESVNNENKLRVDRQWASKEKELDKKLK